MNLYLSLLLVRGAAACGGVALPSLASAADPAQIGRGGLLCAAASPFRREIRSQTAVNQTRPALDHDNMVPVEGTITTFCNGSVGMIRGLEFGRKQQVDFSPALSAARSRRRVTSSRTARARSAIKQYC